MPAAPSSGPYGPRSSRRRALTRRLAVGLVAGAVLAAGCVDDDAAAPSGPVPGGLRAEAGTLAADGRTGATGPRARSTGGSTGVVLAASLRTTASCDALLGELKVEALERVGPYGLDGGVHGPMFATEDSADGAETAAAAESSGGDAAGSAPSPAGERAATAAADAGAGTATHSATNTQEVGVDEPDLVKTDGRRLVVVSGRSVRVVDVTGPAPVLATTIALPDGVHGGELFLRGDRAFLLSTGWTEEPLRGAADVALPVGLAVSRLIELDLAAGRLVGTLEIEGGYLSAREVDGTVRLVFSSPTVGLPFVFPANPRAEESAEATNREVIERSTIEQWLPAFRSRDGDGNPTGEGLLVPCEDVHLPDELDGFGSLSVVTVDLDAGLAPGDAVGVVTDGQTVYASTERLVVATTRWTPSPSVDPRDDRSIAPVPGDESTALHTFDISDPARIDHVASGAVAGRLVDQFALDHHEGLLRIATTEGEMWGDPPDSESFVTLLREAGGGLEVVGRVGGMGVGEQIQSVRFGDAVAYVVTFRQTDPFYVVDLSDPATPRVTGELKIPGFSSYLHPVAPTLVLGVGQDATEDGMVTGAQVSLFDVSDPATPQRVAQLDLGEGSWSLAAEDHRAFLWWSPEGLAVVPLSQSGWTREGTEAGPAFEGAVLVHLDEAGGLAEVGRVAHPATEECALPVEPMPRPAIEPGTAIGERAVIGPTEPECWPWQAPISRAVVVGDALYTVSDAGVQANALADLTVRGFVPFEG